MKKIITMLTILISTSTFGQNHFAGLQVGVSRTNVKTTYFNYNDNRTGFNTGLSYQYYLNKRFNFGVDLLYFQKGYTAKILFTDQFGNPNGQSQTNRLNYDYLVVPLKGGVVIGDKFSVFANLGIVPSLFVDASITSLKVNGIKEKSRYNVTDKVTKLDLGGLIEIGASYKITPDFLLYTSLGYLPNFTSTSITNPRYFFDIRHYGMALSVGARYALKKE